MVNFSTNQTMQFYVYDGACEVKPTMDGKAYLQFTHEDGDVVNSDKIENVMWGKLTDAASLKRDLKKVTLTVKSAVVPGEIYAVRVKYPEIGGTGIEAWTVKTAAYTAKQGDAATVVCEKLAETLKVALAVDEVVTVEAKGATLEFTCVNPTKHYKRGLRPVAIPDFEVSFSPVKDDEEWASLTKATSGSVSGTYKLADMEYFAMGERGDQYRYVDYINAIDTKYRVNLGTEYSVFVLHYAYTGYNQNSHKSEKEIVIAVPAAKLEAFGTVVTALKALGGNFTKVEDKEESAL